MHNPINNAIGYFPNTHESDWTLKNKTWVHKDAIVDVPLENLLGGYIRSGDVIENARVSDNVCVFDKARLSGNAHVSDNARVFGNALVFHDAHVSGNAKVYGKACVSDAARVYGNAMIRDESRVSDAARVYDNARIFGKSLISDYAHVSGNAMVCGDACLLGYVHVSGVVCISGNAMIEKSDDVLVFSYVGSEHKTLTVFRTKDGYKLHRGCFLGTIDEFIKAVNETHGDNQYAKEYNLIIEVIKNRFENVE